MMIHSMTAFARREIQTDDGSRLTWEMRSLNQRFLEARLRLPEGFYHLEEKLRHALSQQFKRGKVEGTLHYQPGSQAVTRQINPAQLDALIALAKQVQATEPTAQPLRTIELLNWPGVLVEETSTKQPASALNDAVMALFQEAVQDLSAARGREGAELANCLAQQVSAFSAQIQLAQTHYPKALDLSRQRLLARFEEAKIHLDVDRLEQEMVMLAQKSDIKEEVERLAAHVTEFTHALNQGGVVGRRLDFLLQELNREANTLGSKAISTALSQVAIELKVLIEQAREQVQNIE